MPMDEVAQNVIELDEVLGAEVLALHEQIGNMQSVGLQFALLVRVRAPACCA